MFKKKENIKDTFFYANILISIFIIVLLIYIISTITLLFKYNWLEVINLLNTLYFNESIKTYLINNKETFSGLLFIYLIFLGYVSKSKGLIFYDNQKHGVYIYPIITIHNGLSFLLPIYLIYIFGNTLEFIALIIVAILSIINLVILNLYIKIRGDYEGMNNYIPNGKININKIILNFESLTRYEFFTYIFSTLLSHGKYILVIAFLIFPIGIINEFNLISILYIHLTFVLIYVSISIMTNKLSPIINIKFDGKEKKNLILVDQDEKKYILKGEKETYIVDKSKVEYILQKNTDIK
ncbi:MAG: hypothetical protein PHH98_03025 [Candidatus Gracilibacteria bacterium]|nr:hypothetical protein [Candidatus Gracilibacteria bacterium]